MATQQCTLAAQSPANLQALPSVYIPASRPKMRQWGFGGAAPSVVIDQPWVQFLTRWGEEAKGRSRHDACEEARRQRGIP